VADLEVSTREAHEGYIRRTIGPVLGEVKIRQLGADSLDALYTALKKCSRLCGRLPRAEHYADGEHACDQRCGPLRDHRTTRPHLCDTRCRPHACRPMKPATILRIHSIISSALDLAVRYEWAERNVAKNARPPHPRKREPDPPTPEQAARLLNLVWAEDEEFGLYLWTAITTGARRGTDLNTVAGRLGHAEGSTTLKFYAQFTRPADQHAAAVIPAQLDELRRKERLRELYRLHPPIPGADGLAALAAVIGPQAGLEEGTALAWLTEFAAAD